MPFSRARYVTLCQQSLVTAAVLAVGVSAAGVKTLDIVPAPGTSADVTESTPGPAHERPATDAPRALGQSQKRPAPTQSDAEPVTPTVREVEVRGIAGRPASRPRATTPAPESTEPQREDAEHEHEHGTPEEPKRLVALSEPEPVQGYATVGVTWKGQADYAESQIAVEVRTRKNGTWSEWSPAEYHEEHAPDGGSPESRGVERAGTDALVIGDVERVQMKAETSDGSAPPDLELAVIDPGQGELVRERPAIDTGASSAAGEQPQALETEQGDVVDSVALSAMRTAPKPQIYSRAQWGANESLRDQSAPGYGTVKTGFVHHTVNANGYTAEQVPALLRGIYAYHTQSRGWRDVGYNFLVDRFGRIWEGRYGGVSRAVIGAHTSGFNEVSFSMSAIGNFDTASPPQVVSDAYARLFAWKLSLSNVRADATGLQINGRTLRGINGHRDAGSTACPGRYLYAKLPTVRTASQRIQTAAQSGTAPSPSPTPTPTPDPTTFTSPTQRPRAAQTQPAITFPKSLNLAGDAHPDLVVRSGTGAVRVVPTGGQTGFDAAGSTPGRWDTKDLIAAVGDVTGDGKGDVLGRLATTKVTRIYPGDGSGHFAESGSYATSVFRDMDLVVSGGDWNRDGRSDVLARHASSGWLGLHPGTGPGTFGPRVVLSKYGKNLRQVAVLGDVTGDGRSDLAGLHRDGYLYVASSTATGKVSSFVKKRWLGASYDTVAAAGRDLSGDRIGDVVVRSSRTGASKILVGRSGGGFAPRALGPFAGAAGLTKITAAQAAGGPGSDIVGVTRAGTALVVLAHNDRVNLRAPLPGNLTRTDIVQVLNAGDWNGDGKGDVITRQSSGDSLVLRPGLGNGQFASGVRMSAGWKPFVKLAAVGDVTGDRDPDLIGRRATGDTVIFPGNGAKGFEAPMLAPSLVKSYNQIGTGSWRAQLLPGSAYASSDGSFVPFAGTTATRPQGYDWLIGPGDVDGDGRPDLVGRDSVGSLWLLPGTSSGLGPRRFLAGGFKGDTAGG